MASFYEKLEHVIHKIFPKSWNKFRRVESYTIAGIRIMLRLDFYEWHLTDSSNGVMVPDKKRKTDFEITKV